MSRAMIICFGIDTIAKRGGLILLAISLMSFLGLCLYWNIARTPFIYERHHLKWNVAPVPKDSQDYSWFRFDEARQTHKLDKRCLEKIRREKSSKTDIFRSERIYAEECVIDVTKDKPETITKWNTSFDKFADFLIKSGFVPWIVGSFLFSFLLFSGLAEHLFTWMKTGQWPKDDKPKKLDAENITTRIGKLSFRKELFICWIIIGASFLAWMFYEDWYNASAAYLEVMVKVGLFAALVWLCKKAWHRIKRD